MPDPVVQPEIDSSKMLDAIASVDTPEAPAGEASEQTEPTGEPVATEAAEGEPAGVMLKDGKTVVPYTVLKETRDEANQYRQEIGSLRAQLEAAQKSQAGGAQLDIADLPTDDQLADYPEDLQGSFKALRDKVLMLNGSLQEMQTEREQAELEGKRAYYNSVIDKFPLLKQIEAAGGPRYEQGKMISEQIRSAPGYDRTQSLEDHLKEVDQRLREAVKAEMSLFGMAPPTPATEATGKRPLPEKIPSPPSSMSDIPGGAPPALSEADAFLNMNDIDAISVMAKAKQTGGQNKLDALLSRTYR